MYATVAEYSACVGYCPAPGEYAPVTGQRTACVIYGRNRPLGVALFGKDGQQTGSAVNERALSDTVLKLYSEALNSGYPPERADKETRLGLTVLRTLARLKDTADAVCLTEHPLQLPWTGAYSLTAALCDPESVLNLPDLPDSWRNLLE